MTTTLGRLEQVELQNAWASEPGDFTPWLAREENLALLGDTIGLDLELEAQEKSVGPFRADILCKDTATSAWVLVENQLQRTDHTHLGQLLTYAAGLKAVTIVWIAARFTDEHRAALDWLNEITDECFNFFGLEVELWRIGDSPMAPKFNVVCQPNGWARRVTEGAARIQEEVRLGIGQLQFEFWSGFRAYVQDQGGQIKPTKPMPQNWMSMGIGKSGCLLSAVASSWNTEKGIYGAGELRAEVLLVDSHSKTYFDQLSDQRTEIEAEMKEPLQWSKPEQVKMCKIYLRREAQLDRRENWPEYWRWLHEKLEALHRVFRLRVKQLDADAPEAAQTEGHLESAS